MKKLLIGLITSLSIAVFCLIVFYAFIYAPTGEVPLPKMAAESISTQKISSALYPERLLIPDLKVDTAIREVGITAKGNMATPNNFKDVGWYKYGTLPGSKGSAVIAGHVDNGLALPAVFYHLDNLQKGNDIYIKEVGGKTLHFKVTRKDVYDFNASVPEVFDQNNGKYLKLITCAGVWVDKYKTHNKRLVVSALLVDI